MLEEESQRLVENGGENVQCLRRPLRQHEEVADEQIFATTIVDEGVLMTAEQRLVGISEKRLDHLVVLATCMKSATKFVIYFCMTVSRCFPD